MSLLAPHVCCNDGSIEVPACELGLTWQAVGDVGAEIAYDLIIGCMRHLVQVISVAKQNLVQDYLVRGLYFLAGFDGVFIECLSDVLNLSPFRLILCEFPPKF